jgi:hypothetical protein
MRVRVKPRIKQASQVGMWHAFHNRGGIAEQWIKGKNRDKSTHL